MPENPSLAKQAAFYDKKWVGAAERGRLSSLQLSRASAVFEALAYLRSSFRFGLHETPRICDLGCGWGWMSALMSQVGDVTGVDLSPEGVSLASRRWPHVEFISADILEFQAVHTFDLIVSLGVIAHIPDANKDRFIQSIVRNIKPGGFVIVVTGNARETSGQQPIENPVTVAGLRRLFAEAFETLYHTALRAEYPGQGIYRVLGAPRLTHFLRRTRLLPAYRGLLSAMNLGPHQILVAQRR